MKQTDQSNSFSDTIDVQTGINEMMQVPEFINAFGVIFKDEMIIHKSDRANSIRLKNISNIAFIKNRKRHLELFCFCLSGILIFNIINYENPLLFNLFLSLMSLLLLFLGVFFQFFEYKLIIVSKYGFVTIIVNERFKEEAEEMSRYLKNRIGFF